ncbi:MAG: SAM-dependent DNA methyltransferase [Gammaproteobacteria bacterium]|nr:SAM-dependent DNA methyltransferase [Gammaproteobacteria bacterium]
MNHSEIVSFIWSVADLIRDTFKRGKYQDVILPMTVLRRLDCVLAPTKPEVLRRFEELKGRPEAMAGQLRRASGFDFYNVSPYDFERLIADPPNLADNLRSYIARFSSNMREVLEAFRFGNTISMLDEGRLLYSVVQRFKDADLHPDRIDNPTMGTIFEELLRKFNEALNENPGEHFTPRDVVHLMVELMLAGDGDHIARTGAVHDIYDPCCGSGGMLMIAKEHIAIGRRENGQVIRPAISESAEIHLFGQETNPETWAVSKSDLYIKDPTGRDAKNIKLGSVLSRDYHRRKFDYLITNPPYGKRWTTDKREVKAEHARGSAGRFGPGLPRISDGQLLFLLHMLSRMREPDAGPGPGGSRVAIIMNGSPLFSGDAGSGESEIRRHVLENDLLEALIALPEQLFYNTGIATYVWLLTNRKSPERRGRVQLIDATSLWTQMKRSLGDKRREIPIEKADDILGILARFRDREARTVRADGEEEEVTVGRVLSTTRFGFRKVTIERPLRLNFQTSENRIGRLAEQTAFRRLSKRLRKASEKARRKGEETQESIQAMLAGMPDTLFKDRDEFLSALAASAKDADIKLRAPVRNAIVAALSERDETAEICRDRDGNPEPDPKLRDYERVPLPDREGPADESGVPASVRDFIDREVAPHRPDAWINLSKVDTKDGKVGIVGYEINFNRHFYRFRPPRPLEEIQQDIVEVESEIMEILRDVVGTAF